MADEFKGAIFDLDGVITATARVHAKAWESMFNDFLREIARNEGKNFVPFDPRGDYLNYVDGKPRFEGVLSFLKSRNIQLPPGNPDDAPGTDTICALGNRKNEDFRKILQEEGPEVFETSVRFVKQLKRKGVRVGVASSSKNCGMVLELAGLSDLFETMVDGQVSEQLDLKGKPEPDIFVTAAANLGLHPSTCVVVEDAISGVQAGRKGNFGLVLGIARNVEGDMLRRFGADQVVTDLGELTVRDVERWFETGIAEDGWLISWHGLDPGDEKLRETLTTVGNGYLGTRGSFECECSSFNHYPGTYIAGFFNKAPSLVEGREIWNNDFVNCPNWTAIQIKIGSGEFMSPVQMELLSYQHRLNMRDAVMERSMVCRDKLGRITRICSQRIASMHNPHLCGIEFSVTPCNYSANVTIRSSLDGNVINDGVARYRQLNSTHLEYLDSGETEEGVYLRMRTIHSKYRVVMSVKHNVQENGKGLDARKRMFRNKALVGEEVRLSCRENHTYTLEKLVSVYTSLDKDVIRPKVAAEYALTGVKNFAALFKPHSKAWRSLWDRADFVIEGDRFCQKVARLHAYHLMVTASPHNESIDAGMPARGLHGEAYRGHIFWDEVYILPFFHHNFPKISEALLKYRFRRMDAAMEYARQNGYQGAMFPWQTADDGSEETQEVHYNPESKSWGPDLSRRQRHVSIAVFYNVWEYCHYTGDQKFLRDYGAELMLEIARFWASIAEKDETTGRWHIAGVMGPDEFHEKLPGSDQPGVRDNAYTNIMVVWLMEKSLDLIKGLSRKTLKHMEAAGFSMAETERWRDISENMNVILTEDGIISQFDGYMDLKELDWEGYRKRFYSIHRMDRILKAEGDSPDNYKVAKQADVLMTYYLLEPDEVARILRKLGHHVDDPIELLRRNYEYYEQRTSHGSTLSKVVHSVISSYFNADDTAWEWFMESMESDIFDTQGGTTIEGVHTGVMAGTLDVITRYFAGVNLFVDVPEISPNLPAHWKRLSFHVQKGSVNYLFNLSHDEVRLKVTGRASKPIPVRMLGKDHVLQLGEDLSVPTAPQEDAVDVVPATLPGEAMDAGEGTE